MKLSTIRRWLRPILAWQSRRALYRACPELRAIDRAIDAAKRQHRSTRLLYARKRKLVAGMMSGAEPRSLALLELGGR